MELQHFLSLIPTPNSHCRFLQYSLQKAYFICLYLETVKRDAFHRKPSVKSIGDVLRFAILAHQFISARVQLCKLQSTDQSGVVRNCG